ncbi:MAG: hypothetical protein IT458_03970 [Planctomycetes bacterium]|nr:hypothetical protein [Planctomycetota bacterium]
MSLFGVLAGVLAVASVLLFVPGAFVPGLARAGLRLAALAGMLAAGLLLLAAGLMAFAERPDPWPFFVLLGLLVNVGLLVLEVKTSRAEADLPR